MNLTEQLKQKKEQSLASIPKEKLDVMLGSTQDLINVHLSNNALKTGDTMVDFELPNVNGKKEALSSYLQKGSTVISFYRGGWCPYCNLELKALQAVLPEIKAKGASLIAISPETPDNSLTTSEKNELEFSVLSDIDNQVAKQIGLVFKMPEALKNVYNDFNLDVAKHNGNNDYELPMAATYVVNSDGKISYAFVSEDYTERADPQDILNVL
ncbi:peroxiredoxin-like family protein [Algibacter aquimarinus]|uniref:thioredoxin-dependent peroxiredoxin n=1 Tax=Algibacter aquimarinus TaxID=1136748 RepID=A0ABP9HHA6_9FLAO